VVAAVEVDAEAVAHLVADTDDALVGELRAAERPVAVDERRAGADADVRHDGAGGVEVVKQVDHGSELADAVTLIAERAAAGVHVVLVLAIDDFQLDPGADEVVTGDTADGEAGLREDGVAEDVGVQQPVTAAFDTEIEARVGLGLRARRQGQHRQCGQSGGRRQNLLHA